MSDQPYHDENRSGRYRLPKHAVHEWETRGYDRVNISTDDLYSVLWWLADLGYSVVADTQLDKDRAQAWEEAVDVMLEGLHLSDNYRPDNPYELDPQ